MMYDKDYSPMRTEEIRDIMKRRGVTIDALAAEMGVDPTRVDQAINGYTFLSDNNAIRIMDALESMKSKREKVPKKT